MTLKLGPPGALDPDEFLARHTAHHSHGRRAATIDVLAVSVILLSVVVLAYVVVRGVL